LSQKNKDFFKICSQAQVIIVVEVISKCTLKALNNQIKDIQWKNKPKKQEAQSDERMNIKLMKSEVFKSVDKKLMQC